MTFQTLDHGAEANLIRCCLELGTAMLREQFNGDPVQLFTLPGNQEIYRMMQKMEKAKEAISIQSVGDAIKASGESPVVNSCMAAAVACGGFFTSEVMTQVLSRVLECHSARILSETGDAMQKGNITLEEALARLQPLAESAAKKPGSLYDAFDKGAIPFPKLKNLGIPPRRPLVGDWLKEGDSAFIFAKRGLGKTWLSLGLATAIVGKENFGPWKVHDHAPVLYIDGEMPCESIEERIAGMGADEDLVVLNHESLFHITGKVLNLTDPEAQDAILRLCLDRGFKVLFLDNLSCLFSGVSENDADAWEMVKPWLLSLRRHKIAVLIVAHAGRNGEMRGTSRREDDTFSVIRLDEASDGGAELRHGARFITRFTKDRNSKIEQPATEWSFQTADNGNVDITTKQADGVAVLIQWVADDVTSASDIAREMGLSTGTVSKMAKRAIASGKLKKEGRGYALAA